MPEPIELSLKSLEQIKLARLQDIVVQVLFELDQNLVMHGGTAIWRCYNGNRFSEDIDIYANDKHVESLLKELPWQQSRRGLRLDYPKYSDTNREFKLSDEFATVTVQIQKPAKGLNAIQMPYKKVDGTNFVINTISIDDFVLEKIKAFESRNYARDLYDIYHLTASYPINSKSKTSLKNLISNIKKPKDGNSLKDFIYVGIAPGFDEMIRAIKERLE
jgi:predicted nucleotidyltransferase component of viral defense system